MPKKIMTQDGRLLAELNDAEVAHTAQMERQAHEIRNALGFELPVTTLTAFNKSIVSQKFFTIPPADYMPVKVGENAWSTNIVTYRDYALGGDFEAGILNTGASNSRLAEADVGVDAVTNKVVNWGKTIHWTIMDLKIAARSGNWDMLTAKEKSRKKNWDLGIQSIAFLGSKTDTGVKGLLTQSTVNSNTSLITQTISSMSETQFATFVQGVISAYRVNCAYTAFPTHFIIPETDYNGLVAPVNQGFAVKSKLEYLSEAFKTATMNPNFKILPLAYAAKSFNSTVSGLNKNRYTLLNYDEDSMRMDIPVDYANTLQNSIDNFGFHNVGYGQFTGFLAYRPLEMLYFDWS